MAEDKSSKSEINFESNQAFGGLDMDSTPSQIDKGKLTYALNAALRTLTPIVLTIRMNQVLNSVYLFLIIIN